MTSSQTTHIQQKWSTQTTKWTTIVVLGLVFIVILTPQVTSWFQLSSPKSSKEALLNVQNNRVLEQVHQTADYKYYFDISEPKTIIGLVVLAAAMCLCTMAGVGGNVVIYPVCLIFFEFDAHVSIGHTSLLGALASLVRVLVELIGAPERKSINYDVILISFAPTLIGSLIGLFFNQFSPDVVIMVLTLSLLGYLMFSTFSAYRKRAQEEWDKEHPTDLHLEEGLIRKPRLRPTKSGRLVELLEFQTNDGNKVAYLPTTMDVVSVELAVHDQYSFKKADLPYYLLFAALNPIFSRLRGTKDKPSLIGIDKCGVSGMLLVLGYLGLLVYLCWAVKKKVVARNQAVHEDGKSIEIDDNNSLRVLGVMMLVGFIASYLSSGAATLLAFSLVLLHMTTFTASPTSLTIMLVLGMTSAVMFYAEGLIYGSTILYAGTVTFLSTLVARLTLYESFLKRGKASLIMMFNSVLMGVSLVAIGGIIGPAVYKEYTAGKNIFAFKHSC